MQFLTNKKQLLQLMIVLIILLANLGSVNLASFAQSDQPTSPSGPDNLEISSADIQDTYSVYIPQLSQDYPWESPFGVEATQPLLESNTLLQRAANLQVGIARMSIEISWRELQPAPGSLINRGLLATFENELRGLKQNGIRPLVMVKDSPYWALDPAKALDGDGQLTSCGPINEIYFGDFATFLQQLVEWYSTDEFNVHDWELGNEPDVDPTTVPRDHLFGCWGDIDDEDYFGGLHYGKMLMAVAPAIRQADSQARVWIGGLLLDKPKSLDPKKDGYPERFFKGVLQAGAAPYFDVVAYHRYAHYFDYTDPTGTRYDYDIYGLWGDVGGVVGKARYLRDHMADYGVDKPVVMNESGFGCSSNHPFCEAPDDRFYESQATHLVRYFIRGLSENISGLVWYTLNGPGWRNAGLLDASQQPRKVYYAYQYLSQKLQYSRYLYVMNYGPGVEAYAFRGNSHRVHVLWAKDDEILDIIVPISSFIEVTDRYGNVLYDHLNPPLQIGSDYYSLQVGFEPIYITYSQ